MNHRLRTASPLMIRLALFLSVGFAGGATAQTPPAQTIPSAARNAADAAPYKPAIEKFVKAQVLLLQDAGQPANVKRGREALEQQVATNGTPSFMSIYATTLDANLAPLASSKDLLTRLNAAIVVARVAQKAQNPALAPSAGKFMNDPSDAVALWGVKAAKSLIPIVLNMNGAVPDPLTPGLANVVKRHWFNGPIAFEAYDALRLNTTPTPAGATAVPGGTPPANNLAIQGAAKQMLAILTFRAELYAKGVPPLPTAEIAACEFLTRSRVWPLLDEAQRGQVVQQLANVITLGGQHAAAVPADQRWPLNNTLTYAGSALQVIGDYVKDPAVVAAGQAVRGLGQAAAAPAILKATSEVFPAVSKSGKWKGLKAPATAAAPGQPLSPNQSAEEEGEAPAAPASTGAGAGTGTTPPP